MNIKMLLKSIIIALVVMIAILGVIGLYMYLATFYPMATFITVCFLAPFSIITFIVYATLKDKDE